MWSEARDKIEEKKIELFSMMHSENDGMSEHLEKTIAKGTVYDIKELYSGWSVEEIKNSIIQLLFGNNWLSFEAHRVGSLLESFSFEQSTTRNRDDEESNDRYEPCNVYPNPEKTLSARHSRQRLINSEKHYIYKTVTNDLDWKSEILWEFNLSYGCLHGIIKEYPKIASKLEWKQRWTKSDSCIQS